MKGRDDNAVADISSSLPLDGQPLSADKAARLLSVRRRIDP